MRDSGLHNYCLICLGKQLNESSVSELFKKARIQNPDWCKIDKKLRNTEHAHKGEVTCTNIPSLQKREGYLIRLLQLQFCELVSLACPNTAAICLNPAVMIFTCYCISGVQHSFVIACLHVPDKGRNSTNIHVSLDITYAIGLISGMQYYCAALEIYLFTC